MSGGRPVLETMMPGTAGDTVTIYHQDGDDLLLVHYCTAGNQPRMRLLPDSDPSDLSFACLGGSNMTEADSHMRSLRLTIIDPDHVRGEWSSVRSSVVEWVAQAELTRRR